MLGAIIGDIAGSKFEWHNHRSKDFEFFDLNSQTTDDSVMTLAVADAVLRSEADPGRLEAQAVSSMKTFGKKYPYAGYGGSFIRWLQSPVSEPYNSYGNGAAMRVSPCAYAADSLEKALLFSDAVTGVTHNHPESIKAARAVTEAIYMAINGADMTEIASVIQEKYYRIDFTLDEIRPVYHFDVSCQGSVPQAFEAFFESVSFEDAVRSAVSIGGDSDTIAAIAGSIAEAYYGIPETMRKQAVSLYLDSFRLDVLSEFEQKYGYYIAEPVNGSFRKKRIAPVRL